MELKQSVVLFPTVGMAHLIPMFELAKLFDAHGFSVTVVVVDPPSDATSSVIDHFVSRVSPTRPSVLFHRLPKITSSKDRSYYHFDTLRIASDQLLRFLELGDSPPNLRAIVLDMFCVAGLDVARALGVPSYVFFPDGAVTLAAFLSLPALQSQLGGGSFRDLGDDAKLDLPGIPPISVSDLPDDVPDRNDTNEELMSHLEHLWRADGFVVNTFEWLEKRAVKALADGFIFNTFEWLEKRAVKALAGGVLCVPGRRNPPVYCVGPLVGSTGRDGGGGDRHECLKWLDARPAEKSVVFVCFGSGHWLSAEQLKEIAVGLERSGHGFLWAVHNPLNDAVEPSVTESELEALLPEGFSERTRGRGMVVASWVPQYEVLVHAAVGAFVSECGWRETLAAAAAGVPVVAWPLFAEQRVNKVLAVEEAKVAVAVEGYGKGMVSAEEVERKIRWVMESEDGKAVRDRAAEAKEEAAAAWKEDGSSALAWLEVLDLLRKKG